MAHLAIIEPRSSGHLLIRRAAELGHRATVFTADRGERCVPADILALAHAVEVIDTNANATVLARVHEIHRRDPLSAVLAGFEHYVPVTARANAELGLPGLSAGTATAMRHKVVMRDTVEDHGIDQPRYVAVAHLDTLDAALAEVGLPCVVKPVDQSGSLNVRKATTRGEAAAAITIIQGYGAEYLERPGLSLALVEEYVRGPEYSIEGYATGSTVVILAITEKLLSAEPWFVEVGHVVPAPLAPDVAARIRRYATGVVRALGLRLGPFHAEVRLTDRGPLLMEVAARLPGDRIPDLLALATGADLPTIMINAHLGLPLPVPVEAAPTRYAGIRYFLDPDLATYQAMRVDPGVRDDPRVLEIGALIPPGRPIPAPGRSASRLGYAIAVADDHRSVTDVLDNVERGVHFIPEPRQPMPYRKEKVGWNGTC